MKEEDVSMVQENSCAREASLLVDSSVPKDG